MTKTKNKIEFGDFQTPLALSAHICSLIKQSGIKPVSLIEPTCGIGNFIISALEQFPSIEKGIALDINPEYIRIAKEKINTDKKIEIHTEDFFEFNWDKHIANLSEPILIIGNPPWVTNSKIGSMSGTNLPRKSNLHKLNGFEALTGKSNFDISEWMLIKFLDTLKNKNAVLAVLCKLSVARKVLAYAWKNYIGIENSKMYEINVKQNFDASVKACLLIVHFSQDTVNKECSWYTSLDAMTPSRTIGYRNGRIVSDIDLYEQWKHLRAQTDQEYIWRSGIKHDCSKIMELRRIGKNLYQNDLGEKIELESEYIYPLIKSSDLFNGRKPTRWVIVTQKKVGDDTSIIEKIAPKTWRYLKIHEAYLAKRTSSIYKNRPAFSIFGIGEYSFSPWKVAISGLYKEPRFRIISTYSSKPILPDDTVNFISFEQFEKAQELTNVLNSDSALNFLKAMTFVDAKRPYTVDLLKQLDVCKLINKPRTKLSLFQ